MGIKIATGCVTDLVRVIREVDFVEDLGGFVLDGLYLHQVRGILSGSISTKSDGRARRGR